MGLSRLQVGAHTLCHINSKLFGRVASISYKSSTPRRKIRCIDTLLTPELVPLAVEVSGTMTIYRLHGDGGIQAAGMIPTWTQLTRGKYFSLLITDRLSDTTTFRVDACEVLGESWEHGRGYSMGTVQFEGLQWQNETQPVAG